MKISDSFSLILDMEELSEFIGIADDELRKQIASHIASIGMLASDAIMTPKLGKKPKDDDDNVKGDEEEDDDEEFIEIVVGGVTYLQRSFLSCLIGFTALSEILREYDVRAGFLPRMQLLMLVKSPTALLAANGPDFLESHEEFMELDGEKASIPLTAGVTESFFEYADGALFNYRTRNDENNGDDEEEDDDEL